MDDNKKPVIIKMKLVNLKHMKTKHLSYSCIQDFTENHIEKGSERVQLLQRALFNKFRSIKDMFELTVVRLTHTFKGLTSRYLQLYLDEACYRINLTLQNKPIFENLTQHCMSIRRY